MARKARVESPGALYHVLDRGDRREAIFRDDRDRERFLETLGEGCGRTGWLVHAFVLMGNHYHLFVETPQANLVAGMRWFQTTCTVRFNRRHHVNGHLFQGRYKAVVVDPAERSYFATLSDYIHLNPVRARLVALEGRLFDYRWSSYPFYVRATGRPEWFEPRAVLGEPGLADTTTAAAAMPSACAPRPWPSSRARRPRPTPDCGAAGASGVKASANACCDCSTAPVKSCVCGAKSMGSCAGSTARRKPAGLWTTGCGIWA